MKSKRLGNGADGGTILRKHVRETPTSMVNLFVHTESCAWQCLERTIYKWDVYSRHVTTIHSLIVSHVPWFITFLFHSRSGLSVSRSLILAANLFVFVFAHLFLETHFDFFRGDWRKYIQWRRRQSVNDLVIFSLLFWDLLLNLVAVAAFTYSRTSLNRTKGGIHFTQLLLSLNYASVQVQRYYSSPSCVISCKIFKHQFQSVEYIIIDVLRTRAHCNESKMVDIHNNVSAGSDTVSDRCASIFTTTETKMW